MKTARALQRPASTGEPGSAGSTSSARKRAHHGESAGSNPAAPERAQGEGTLRRKCNRGSARAPCSTPKPGTVAAPTPCSARERNTHTGERTGGVIHARTSTRHGSATQEATREHTGEALQGAGRVERLTVGSTVRVQQGGVYRAPCESITEAAPRARVRALRRNREGHSENVRATRKHTTRESVIHITPGENRK